MNKGRGFTLIELIVVVTIVAILAAIALPSYVAQVRHSRRSEVQGAIQSAALAEERVRADCSTYAQVAATADWTTAPTGCSSSVTLGGNPYTSSYYTITIPAANVSSTSYTIVATAVGSQASDTAFGTPCDTLQYAYSAGVIQRYSHNTTADTACWTQ